MKKSKSHPAPDVKPEPNSTPTDSVVDDLSQQDVLPVDEESIPVDDRETLTGALAQAGQWDDPVVDLGHWVTNQPLEDEVKASEELVMQGVDEADEELRDLDEEEEAEEERDEENE